MGTAEILQEYYNSLSETFLRWDELRGNGLVRRQGWNLKHATLGLHACHIWCWYKALSVGPALLLNTAVGSLASTSLCALYNSPYFLFLSLLNFFFLLFLASFFLCFFPLTFSLLSPPSGWFSSTLSFVYSSLLSFICLEQIFKSINPLQQRDCVEAASEPADVVGPGFQ